MNRARRLTVAVYERKMLAVDGQQRKCWQFYGIETPYNRPPLKGILGYVHFLVLVSCVVLKAHFVRIAMTNKDSALKPQNQPG